MEPTPSTYLTRAQLRNYSDVMRDLAAVLARISNALGDESFAATVADDKPGFMALSQMDDDLTALMAASAEWSVKFVRAYVQAMKPEGDQP